MKKWVLFAVALVIVSTIAVALTQADFDQDGMPDDWEKKNSLRFDINDARLDPDKDGIKNVDEFKQGSNPHVADFEDKVTKEDSSIPAATSKDEPAAFHIDSLTISLFAVAFIAVSILIFTIAKLFSRKPRKPAQKTGLKTPARAAAYNKGARARAFERRAYPQKPAVNFRLRSPIQTPKSPARSFASAPVQTPKPVAKAAYEEKKVEPAVTKIEVPAPARNEHRARLAEIAGKTSLDAESKKSVLSRLSELSKAEIIGRKDAFEILSNKIKQKKAVV